MRTSMLAQVFSPLGAYTHWLHTRWPAGTVEHLPEVGTDGETSLRGVRIVGDLSGIPLLKFSADTGARAVQAILREPAFGKKDGGSGILDLVVLGGGVSGISAALEARKAGLRFKVFEAAEPFTTIANFPQAKPIYTYPTDMTPAGEMQFHADVKEALLEELEKQRRDAGIEITLARAERVESDGDSLTVHFAGDDAPPAVRARRVIVAIGRSGDFRRLGVLGENSEKVANRLHDPADFA
ncbi:MAG: FAD-binding protein, partial [Verrucomicrobia bacterium]|nr:FAD-binding protein [Verrucomicrobiota bacterium]